LKIDNDNIANIKSPDISKNGHKDSSSRIKSPDITKDGKSEESKTTVKSPSLKERYREKVEERENKKSRTENSSRIKSPNPLNDNKYKDRDYKNRDYKNRDYKNRDYKNRDYKDRDHKSKSNHYHHSSNSYSRYTSQELNNVVYDPKQMRKNSVNFIFLLFVLKDYKFEIFI